MKSAIAFMGAAVLAATGAGAHATVITFNFYPGPDGLLGTPDDIPIVAPDLFSQQTLQLTNEFETLGILFLSTGDNMNEILNSSSFTTPPAHTPPNLLASSGTLDIEFQFTFDVFEVEALIGISGGSDEMKAYDAMGVLIDSVVGDDVAVSITSVVPIHTVVISAYGGSTTPAIDNLTFADIPAPGVISLLALAGLAGARRRRR